MNSLHHNVVLYRVKGITLSSCLAISMAVAFAASASADDIEIRPPAPATEQGTEDRLLIPNVQLLAMHDVQVPVTTQGQIQKLAVHPGDVVQQGTMLAQLRDDEARSAVAAAEIELKLAEIQSRDQSDLTLAQQQLAKSIKSLARLKRLQQRSSASVPLEQLDLAELAVHESESAVSRAKSALAVSETTVELKQQSLVSHRLRLEKNKILCPLQGTVVEVRFDPGEWVREGDVVFRVVDASRLRIEAYLDSQIATPSLLGEPADFISATNQERYRGKITFVDPTIQAVTGQARVWVELENKAGELRPGGRGQLSLIRSRANHP